jgi:hypothetical protein
MVREVDAGWNVVHVHEDFFSPKSLSKSVVQSTGYSFRIVSAVVDENHLTGPAPILNYSG